MALDCLPYIIIGLIFLGALVQCIKDTVKYMKCEPAKATVKNVVNKKDSDNHDYYLVDVDYCTEYGKYGSAKIAVHGRYKIGETLDARYDKEKDELILEQGKFKINIIVACVVMLVCIIKIIGIVKP